MKRPLSFLSALVLLPALACTVEEAAPEERVGSLVDQQVEEINEQSEVFCDCWEDYGYRSRSECNDDAFVLGPSQVRCIKDAYAQDPQVAVDYLECIVPLEQEYTACVNQRLECSDGLSTDPCGEDFSVGHDNCIGLPSAITRDLDTCFE